MVFLGLSGIERRLQGSTGLAALTACHSLLKCNGQKFIIVKTCVNQIGTQKLLQTTLYTSLLQLEDAV